jgi:catechol 2,3-dioxygenase-like lactoylglutathione lyase family enzyme
MSPFSRITAARIYDVLDHVTLRVSDFERSHHFYTTVLAPLGFEAGYTNHERGFAEWGDFSIMLVADGRPLSQNVHVGFAAADNAAVDAFWQAGVDAGYASNGEPGERPQYHAGYYGAFLLDPDGNNVEAVCHNR